MTTKAKRFPMRLKLLPGLRWTGWMRVQGPIDGGYLVDWDAFDPKAEQAPYILDVAVLTAKQIHDWTGVEVS